jgi:hypothetical protein
MLVQTIVYFAPEAILTLPQIVNAQTFGTIVIGPDLTQQLVITAPIANNNAFNNPTIALGTPQSLAPTKYTNTNTLNAPTIAIVGGGGGGGPLLLDGTGTGSFSVGTSGTVTLTTTMADDIVVIGVGTEKNATAIQTVTSIADVAGLTWNFAGRASETNQQCLEVWWAHAPAALTGDVITVTISGTTDDAVMLAFGVNGANLLSPLDTNVSNPDEVFGTGNGHPTATLDTTASDTMIIGISANRSGATYSAGVFPAGRDGPGYTHITDAANFGASRQMVIGAEYKIVSSPQSALTVDFIFPGNADWLIIGIAIRQA